VVDKFALLVDVLAALAVAAAPERRLPPTRRSPTVFFSYLFFLAKSPRFSLPFQPDDSGADSAGRLNPQAD
jgi:hypothetical protein